MTGTELQSKTTLNDEVKNKVLEAFTKCQDSQYNLMKLAELLKKYYEEISKKESKQEKFVSTFNHCVVCGLNTANTDSLAERYIQFITTFAALFANTEDEDYEEDDDNFLSSSNKTVRYRSCQLVHGLFSAIPTYAQLDEHIVTLCTKAMLERIKDRNSNVRAQAARALVRLQQPRLLNCPIIKAFLFHLECDESAAVRMMVVSTIAITVRTLPAVLDRVRDVSANVRKATFKIISQKVSMQALKNEQRLYLVVHGLSDNCSMVRKRFVTDVLLIWLSQVKDDLEVFLRGLDVVGANETSISALKAILASQGTSVVDKFQLLDDNNLIPIDKLSPESVTYWSVLCDFMRSENLLESLDRLLPSTFIFAEFIYRYFEKLLPFMSKPPQLDEDEEDAKVEIEFVMESLLKMASKLDFSDVAGLNRMQEVVIALIPQVRLIIFPNMFKALAELFVFLSLLHRSESEGIDAVARVISDLRTPQDQNQDVGQCGVSDEEVDELRMKKAKMTVELHELKDQLEVLINEKKFEEASVCQKEVKKLEDEIENLQKQFNNKNNNDMTLSEDAYEKSDDNTILKCLRITTEIARKTFSNRCTRKVADGISPTLLTLIDSIVLRAFFSSLAVIRQEAVIALGASCLFCKKLAAQHFTLFMKVAEVDVYVIRVESIKIICDFIRIFGCRALLEPNYEVEDNEYDNESAKNLLMNKFVTMINDDEFEIREAAISLLVRVMVSHQVLSPHIFCQLILHWHNPLTVSDPTIIELIGNFLDTFPNMSRLAHDCVQSAFMPTLRVLVNPPKSSPYSAVNISTLISIFLTITSPSIILSAWKTKRCNISGYDWLNEGSAHDNIAVMLSNEVLSDPTAPHVATLCGALLKLQLNSDLKENIKDLKVLCDNMLLEVEDKRALKYIREFQYSLPSYDDDVTVDDDVTADDDVTNVTIKVDDVATSSDSSRSNDVTATPLLSRNSMTSSSQTSNFTSGSLRTPKKRRQNFSVSPPPKAAGQIFVTPRKVKKDL